MSDYENGALTVSQGATVDPPFILPIGTDVEASNVYHLLKALGDEVPRWIEYLKTHGVPNLVQSVNTGTTPLYNSHGYHPDGLQPL